MRCLKCSAPNELRWEDADTPVLFGRSSVLLRPLIVSRSDLEARILTGDLKIAQGIGRFLHRPDKAWSQLVRPDFFKKPFVVGSQGIGEVVETGPDVRTLRVGHRVIIPEQLSCGYCSFCKAHGSGQCENYKHDRFGGFGLNAERGGLLADLVQVPDVDRQLERLPEELDPLTYACAGGDLVHAWSRVQSNLQHLAKRRVLVLGGQAASQGLYATAFALALGAESVVYQDDSAERVALADALGANASEGNGSRLKGEFDLVVCASARAELLEAAIQALAAGGVCALLVPPDSTGIRLPLKTLYARNARLDIGMPDILGELPKMLAFLRRKPLPIAIVNTHVAAFDEADDAFLKDTTRVAVSRYQ